MKFNLIEKTIDKIVFLLYTIINQKQRRRVVINYLLYREKVVGENF